MIITKRTLSVSSMIALILIASNTIGSLQGERAEIRSLYIRRVSSRALINLDIDRLFSCPAVAAESSPQKIATLTAFIAVANYARPPLLRWAKLRYAAAILATRGYLPNRSLGAGNIRPSNIEKLVEAGLLGPEWGAAPHQLEALSDYCLSVDTTATFIEFLRRSNNLDLSNQDDVLRLSQIYNGEISSNGRNPAYHNTIWQINQAVMECLQQKRWVQCRTRPFMCDLFVRDGSTRRPISRVTNG